MRRDAFQAIADPTIRTDILVVGSGQLVQSLLQYDLIDELRLMISPIVIGTGKGFLKRLTSQNV